MENEVASTLEQIQVNNYLHLFAITFLYWDHLLTFPGEVKYIWRRSKCASSHWFFLNRYFAPLGNASVIVLLFTDLSESRCRMFSLYRQILLIVNQVLVCVLLTIRIYALYSKSKKILAYMLTSGAILAGVACFVMFGQDNSPSSVGTGCHLQFERITAIRLAAAWEALFIYDTILFGLTIYKTWKERPRRRLGISEGRMYMPLVTLVLRDGAIYYAVMALANFVNIMTFYFAGPFLRGSLSTFSSCMATTMMSRLMLNLHRSAPDQGILSTVSTTTNMVFGSNATSTDVELDTLNTDDFRIISTMLSDLQSASRTATEQRGVNRDDQRPLDGFISSNAEEGISRYPP